MILIEKHSSSDYKYKYLCNMSGASAIKPPSIKFSLIRRIKEIFLPQGYPESVSNDYLEYQIWDTIQALVSTITSTVANQAILKGIGVGDDKATVLAATITWIMKDGAGLIGRILFAYWKGTFLDCNCKRWRLFADVVNDVSIFLDLFTSFLPRSTFLLIVCISSVGRSLVGVAGGATRAALTMHQARKNNVADVSAKDGSQESLSNLIGLVMNLLVVTTMTSSPQQVWSLVVLLTMLHLYCNYRAMRAVCMTSFNQSRFHLNARHWLETGHVVSVKQCNLSEPVWTGLHRPRLNNVTVGCSISQLSLLMQRQLAQVFQTFSDDKYVLLMDRRPGSKRAEVSILLKTGALCSDQIKALLHAEIIDHLLLSDRHRLQKPTVVSADRDIDLIHQSLELCAKMFSQFETDCRQAGWVLDPVLFGASEWSIDSD